MPTSMRCPNYEKLAENNPFANAEFILTNGTIKVSKTVLCYYSDYFYDLFMKDSTKDDLQVAANASQKNESAQMDLEMEFALHVLGISLVNNILGQEIIYMSMNK
uniref:BTB domain-containing protein n=1 Tax=Rhabditophanes sp. KR3021 TaxID=114890 RepID=A0AC35TZ07_9BILA